MEGVTPGCNEDVAEAEEVEVSEREAVGEEDAPIVTLPVGEREEEDVREREAVKLGVLVDEMIEEAEAPGRSVFVEDKLLIFEAEAPGMAVTVGKGGAL